MATVGVKELTLFHF